VASGRQTAVLDGTDAPTFSPDGKSLAVGRNGIVEFWDLTHDPPQRQSALGQPLSDPQPGFAAFVFSPDGRSGAEAHQSGGNDWVRIWKWQGTRWERGARGSELTKHGWFRPRAFSPDGKTLAVGGEVLKIYSVESGEELRTLQGHTDLVWSVAFSPDGKSLASGGQDRILRVWNTLTGAQRLGYPHPGPILSVAFAPDGKTIVTGGPHGLLRLWDAAPMEEPSVLRHPGGQATYVAFAPMGNRPVEKYSVGASSNDPESGVWLWDVANGQERAILACSMRTLALSHGGARLAVRRENDVELWDLPTRRLEAAFPWHELVYPALAFSPDDRTLASSIGPAHTAKLWDLATRHAALNLNVASTMSCVAFSPNGQTLVTGGQGEYVQLWEASSGRQLRMLQDQQPGLGAWTCSVAFSPDGMTVAAAGQMGTVRLWDVASGHLRVSLYGQSVSIRSLAFSPDGKTLATACHDGMVRLWDPILGQEKGAFQLHAGPVRSVAFSLGGSMLAAGTADGTIRIWRASDDAQAKAFQNDTDASADEGVPSAGGPMRAATSREARD
jgi:WD40 repeat protein